MTDILKEILKNLPDDIISEAGFEGANIVLYTKDRDFFFNDNQTIKKIVNMIKKRIELRPDPSLCMEAEKSENEIKKIIPEEAGLGNILFDPQRSVVVIEVSKPGLAIGKQGAILSEIKRRTLWIPLIKRTPAIRSQLIENIRAVLFQNNDYRKKFLNNTGHRIYDGWLRGKKEEWVRVTYLGGGRQVGRSCILLQTPESRILLDCGINIASDEKAFPHLESPDFNIKELDAVIVSHAHLDHCGFIPYLFKFGYKGPIYCTAPTRDVMALLQLDYTKIQRMNGKDPIYTTEEVKEMVKHTITLDYEEVTDITPDVRITLYNAGHILGSSMIHLHVGNGLHNILYTGDMKFARTQLLEPAETKFPRLETLMMESTYGARDSIVPNRHEEEAKLASIVEATIKRKGKVLVPVLGVGRAQEIMMIIENLVRQEKIPEIPIYIDGMVWDVTAIHTAYPEFLNNHLRRSIFHRDSNPFLNKMFRQVGSAKERKEIIEDKGPAIIIATSGMLIGGASVQYLTEMAENKKNTLFFVCYQGEGSLGKRIQNGEREINIGTSMKPKMMKLNLEIHTFEGFSGHADRRELMNFVQRCNPRPKKVILNHGDNSRCLDLASSIHKRFRVETSAPRNLEASRLR